MSLNQPRDPNRPPVCAHMEHGGQCSATLGTRYYLVGFRCPLHTPAALEGRLEVVPDPAWTENHPPVEREPYRYGSSTSDPLGRLGWDKNAHLPKRETST